MANQLRAGVVLNYIIILLNIGVSLLYTPYMLRMLGQSEYGLYSLAASVIAYLTILDLGFGNAIIRYAADFKARGLLKEQYEMFGMFFVIYSIIGVVTLISGYYLYLNIPAFFGDTMTAEELSHAQIMVLIMIANLAITFPMSIYGSIMTAYERFVFPKVINIIRIVLNTITMVALLSWGYKAITMVIVQTVFNLITLFANFLYCKYKLSIKIIFGKFQFALLKEVSIFSFWIFLNTIMDKIYWSTGPFVLGAVVNTTAIAIFGVALQFQGMYMQFSLAISSVFLPKVTSMVAQRTEPTIISNLFIKTGRIQNIVMIFLLSMFIVFGKPFICLWAGGEYSGSYLITLCFFIALYIPLIQNLGITILQARNQLKFRSILYIVIALIALVMQIVFSKWWGGLGCAIAIGGALILGHGLIMNIYYKTHQQISIGLFWKEIMKMNIIPIIVSIVFLILLKDAIISSWIQLFLWGGSFATIYFILFYVFSLSKSEKEMIHNSFCHFTTHDKN